MRPAFYGCLFVLLVGVDALRADVIKGEVKSVDADKGTLTVTVKGKDRDFRVPADARITIQVAGGVIEAKDGLKNPWFTRAAKAAGSGLYVVEVTVEQKEKKDRVTRVHLFTPTRREEPGPETDPFGTRGQPPVREPGGSPIRTERLQGRQGVSREVRAAPRGGRAGEPGASRISEVVPEQPDHADHGQRRPG